ncbi:glycosyltransferase [Apilactobacillus micheneri]|uniref:Glycosyltransferase n=1 Tax=Apilactobacillus micheneri TaxID=1899430 RepID=A0A9Q8ILU6_9LACO|nr:glycosyltransferase family 2 protein [Apilactobacillus micheneri]TPR39898.1 glycosyltransferase [Apilactobacillus micheneri]TPR43819.1 glycosyltransferase [Apilactobacillus micheneri]TPR45372.1 glycosyltransferase [Apilactobacillus micheneri]
MSCIDIILKFSILYYIVYTFNIVYLLLNRSHKNKNYLNIKKSINNKYSLWIIIPALNEETVIKNTVNSLQHELHKLCKINNISANILVVDDCSDDQTFYEARKTSAYVIQTPQNNKHCGKGAVLNHGINFINSICDHKVNNIIGVIDADGVMKYKDFYNIIALYDDNKNKYDMIQSAVKMFNTKNIVEKAQDFEFGGLNRKSQISRNNYGDGIASGNGQFVTLKMALDVKWGNSLLEDMEFTLNGLLKGYHCYFTEDSVVQQQAVKSIKKYIKQRVRWCTGGIQCSHFLFALYKSKNVKLLQKIALTINALTPLAFIFINFSNLISLIIQVRLFIMNPQSNYSFFTLLLIWLLLDLGISNSYRLFINKTNNKKIQLIEAFYFSISFSIINLITFFIPIISIKNILSNNLEWDKTDHST